eukprot:scaffold34168_cov66-Phaeocystis_antarctica.AAC.6
MANITLVIGGARSGKSSYASRLALSACDTPVYAGHPSAATRQDQLMQPLCTICTPPPVCTVC